MSSRLSWSTFPVPGQPGLQRETLSQNQNETVKGAVNGICLLGIANELIEIICVAVHAQEVLDLLTEFPCIATGIESFNSFESALFSLLVFYYQPFFFFFLIVQNLVENGCVVFCPMKSPEFSSVLIAGH